MSVPLPAVLLSSEANRKRTVVARDLDKVLNISHHSSPEVTANTPESELFSANPTCILAPESEVGPFWVKGELIWQDIRHGQPGVPLILDGQFIDINTCEPIQDLYWDVWNCNATGVYSGVQGNRNGNSDDASNLNNTFARGIQKTEFDGVAQFHTLFPGHYAGRATHVHVIAYTQGHVLPNNTLTVVRSHISASSPSTRISSPWLRPPYNENTVAITKNADDRVVQVETENSDSDPFFEYALLGETVRDGIFGWITLGVNVSASHDSDASYAAILTANGGVSNADPGGFF